MSDPDAPTVRKFGSIIGAFEYERECPFCEGSGKRIVVEECLECEGRKEYEDHRGEMVACECCLGEGKFFTKEDCLHCEDGYRWELDVDEC